MTWQPRTIVRMLLARTACLITLSPMPGAAACFLLTLSGRCRPRPHRAERTQEDLEHFRASLAANDLEQAQKVALRLRYWQTITNGLREKQDI